MGNVIGVVDDSQLVCSANSSFKVHDHFSRWAVAGQQQDGVQPERIPDCKVGGQVRGGADQQHLGGRPAAPLKNKGKFLPKLNVINHPHPFQSLHPKMHTLFLE